MNPFNQQLLAAKKQHRLLYIKGTIYFLIGIFIVLSIIIVSRSTRIEVHPDDAAALSSIQLDKGIAILLADTLYSISQNPAITASAEGFQSKTQTVNNNDFGKVISITLEPLPALVELSTNISDNNINWLINGEVLAIANTFKQQLAADDYELTITHPHYNDAFISLSLARNERFKKEIQLTPIDGLLVIQTNPEGAQILIDGVTTGISPLSHSLTGGLHNIAVILDNYESINDRIEISRTKPEVNRDYQLQVKKATVNVSLTPNNGKLLLDGMTINHTNRLAVTADSKHTLSYSKQGYFTVNKTFNIAVDDPLQLDFVLKKEMGRVEIESSPKAKVKLNGKVIGTTPLQLSLNAVNQKITLSKKGFRTETKIVRPSATNTKKVNVTLVTEKIAKLTEAPKQYTHKAGGILKLFIPNDIFIMGAKRSELGQRANEVEKTIKLSKAFYAGITEVTNAEYRRYNKNTQGHSKKPVTSISWTEAAGFCNWLSQREGLTPVYHFKNKQLKGINTNTTGYRLLTEAEWEWLARQAGKQTQSLFVWGNEQVIPKNATNIADESANGKVKVLVSKYNDGYPEIAPIKSFTREKSGLYDQAGNVSEWTHDSYSIMPVKSGTVFQDPFDRTITNTHVIKGANWRSGSITELRPSFREGLIESRDDLGFRIGRYVYEENSK